MSERNPKQAAQADKEKGPKGPAVAKADYGVHCKVTEPPVSDGVTYAVRAVPSTKVFNAEGYVTGAGYLIDTVEVQDVVHTQTPVAGQTSDSVTFTASGIATEYGRRTCRADVVFTNENLVPNTDFDEIKFVVMPQKLTFTITGVTGTCPGCANANRTYTLEYNTVVANAWGEVLSSSNPDNRICYAPTIRFSLIANVIDDITGTGGGVPTVAIRPTFTSPSYVVRYTKSTPWDYDTWPLVLNQVSAISCTTNSWPTSISISPG